MPGSGVAWVGSILHELSTYRSFVTEPPVKLSQGLDWCGMKTIVPAIFVPWCFMGLNCLTI